MLVAALFAIPAAAFAPAPGAVRPVLCARTSPLAMSDAATGRLRKKKTATELSIASPIKSGDKLPETDVEMMTEDGVRTVVSLTEALKSSNSSVLIGMPGAFTPTCNDAHMPGLVNNEAAFAEAGIDKVAVITTNDRFVNQAWREAIAACMDKDASSLVMLSDADGDVVGALGLADDMGFGYGIRSKRFAIISDSDSVRTVAHTAHRRPPSPHLPPTRGRW